MAVKIPMGLQLYSVRDEAAKDLAGVLKAVAKMGYDGVEFAGYYNHAAKDVRKMLDDVGLRCCGTHTGINTLLGDELGKTVEYNKVLGNPYLIVPWMPEELRPDAAGWRKVAATMNGIAEKLAPLGMFTGYHNHHFEFSPVAGSSDLPWDLFFANTKPSVIMQLDTGNALHGGADVTPFLTRYPGRATTVHLKEFAKDNPKALIGDGEIDWKTIFNLCETVGKTKWYIVEYESDAYPPMVCVEKCLQKLRGMGK